MAATNSTYPNGAVQWLNQALCLYQSLCLVESGSVPSGSCNTIYNSKKDKPFAFKDFRDFYEWYISLERKCHYCHTPEYMLQTLFAEDSPLKSKRKRGKALEIDRIQPNGSYSRVNCVLSCYVCNNHKSDFISAEDHRRYFGEAIGKYLKEKYQSIINF